MSWQIHFAKLKLKIPKVKYYYGIRVVEESVLIAEPFHIVCIFRREDLITIGVKVISGEKEIEVIPYN
jgi:hypothetical protein